LIEIASAAAVWDAFENLPISSGKVVLFCDVEEFAYEQIADIRGIRSERLYQYLQTPCAGRTK
jgi:DNA-directed RNA polymerase specialized sigma24 family protein